MTASKVAAFPLFTTVKQIDAAILEIHTTGQTLQTLMHKTACSVLNHLAKNRDIRVVQKLLLSMPESSRVNALRTWFETFGPITFDGNDATYAKDKPTNLAKAIGTPFWKLVPEKPYEAMDVAAAIEKLIDRLSIDTKKAGVDHTAVIKGLRTIVAPPVALAN